MISNFKFKISNWLIFFTLACAALFNAGAVLAQSASDKTTINVAVTMEAYCNNNGICEPGFGENESDCFNDCGCNNNNVCESARGEDSDNCPNDCGPVTYFTLTYTASDNGAITGTNPQTVRQGADGAQVTAVANSGYHFTNWSDGSTSAARTDKNVQGNINLTAYFSPFVGGNTLLLLKPFIKNLKISKITFNSAEISWQTNVPAFCTTNLGKTTEYEKEIISETESADNHFAELTGLDSSTIYHFNISCKTINKLTAGTGDKYFASISAPAPVPAPVAVGGGNKSIPPVVKIPEKPEKVPQPAGSAPAKPAKNKAKSTNIIFYIIAIILLLLILLLIILKKKKKKN